MNTTTALKYLAPVHVAIGIVLQLALYLAGAMTLWQGVAPVAAFFISRELDEAGYRYIENFTPNRLRAEMPLLGPFDARVWAMSPKSFTDFLVPIAVACAIAQVAHLFV